MSKTVNDPITAFVNAANASVIAGDKAEHAIGSIAKTYHDLLPVDGGYCERLSDRVISWETLASSEEARKHVLKRILDLSDISNDALADLKKRAKDGYDPKLQTKWAEMVKARTNATIAMEFFAAIITLELRTKKSCIWGTNAIMFPAEWFVPDGFKLITDFRSSQFKLRSVRSAEFVTCTTVDPAHIPDGHSGLWKFPVSATINGVIEASTGKKREKRGARPGGNEKSDGSASSSNDASSDGATGEQQKERKRATPSEARDICVLEAGRDDYKHRPTGEVATEWQSMFDHMALNPFYRAMMIKAIAKANKTEGEAAASQNAA